MITKEKILELLKNHSQKSVIGWAVEEDDFEVLADEIVKNCSIQSVTRCVLSDKDQAERKILIDLQQDEDRWFSEEEFNRLLELNKKAFENHKALHGG